MTFLFDWIFLLFRGSDFIISSLVILYGDDYMFGDLNIAVAQLVESLRYKPEGRGFDSRWCHWKFFY